MCRSHVHTLTKRFTHEENELSSAQKSAVSADIDLFNRWHSNLPVPVSWWLTFVLCFTQ
ncbi:hypothetical protein P879_11430 [Paragonimus westermani]|uniref:Uncharacterized protein n=1 Tax=Paragonimus westermani TaxID=34504 RepID=A0A8T0D709_9TREM|nr:hypothetical protein P879_11430 [Paragonimus westermani]